MTVSFTEQDGTKHTMQGAISAIGIDVQASTISVKVIAMHEDFVYSIKGNVTITESEVL